MTKDAEERLKQAKAQVEITNEIYIDLPKTAVPTTKMILRMEDVSFSYANTPIIKDFSLTMKGPERLALVGSNGSGKTTLVRLIRGVLEPDSGSIEVGAAGVRYLDQRVDCLNLDESILENYRRLNPGVKETEAHLNLAHFLFRNKDALKFVRDLSGGEKLRAALACVLTSDRPPQLLILDEPTNHLDLVSMAALESALRCYQGAMIIISHDQCFLEDVGVERVCHVKF